MRLKLTLALLCFGAALMSAPPRSSAVFAQSGCCKERSSYDGRWGRNGRSYEDCKALNDKKDGDNVLDERGLVWWDARCQ